MSLKKLGLRLRQLKKKKHFLIKKLFRKHLKRSRNLKTKVLLLRRQHPAKMKVQHKKRSL